MASRRDLTKKFAREYAKADKAAKGEILDALVASTGWTRDHARRAIRAAAARKGAARDQQRKRDRQRHHGRGAEGRHNELHRGRVRSHRHQPAS